MKLTKGEYSLFSFSSQKQLLAEKGITITSKEISPLQEGRIYLLNDFFVETLINSSTGEIESINLAVSFPSKYYFE